MNLPRKALHAALLGAFPSRAKLEQAVQYGLGVNLNVLAPESDLSATVFALLTWAEANGKLVALLEAAHGESPGHPDLAALLSKTRAWNVASIPRWLPPRRLFVGRETEIAAVLAVLEQSGQGTITQASVWGLGGVGKTALALEIAHRAVERGEHPAGVWWLLAEGEPLDVMMRLADLLAEHAQGVVGHIPEGLPPDKRAHAFRLALEAYPHPSFLVLDNVDHNLRPYLPGGKVSVLVTTRDAGVAIGGKVKLDVLREENARALAEKLAGPARNEHESAALSRVVVDVLGALAVAVEVAGRAVERLGGWAAYEKHLLASIKVLERESHRSDDYPAGVFAALDLSIGKAGALARRLLEAGAAFAPDAVPLDWAYAAAALDPEDIDAQEACGDLEGLGLFKVDREQGWVSMHRLVRLRVREQANPEARTEVTRRVVGEVRRWLRKTRGLAKEQLEAIDARRAHVEEALALADALGEHEAWSVIANDLAVHLWYRADYSRARSLLEQALARDKKTLGPDHPEVATRLSNLATVLQDLGEADKARPLLERALAIGEKTLGPDHPKVATRLSNLASVHKDLGEAQQARPLLERSLAIVEKTFGPDHPKLATRLSNLAMVHKDLGEAHKARPLLERALAIGEKALGPDHPKVAILLSNLAMVLQDLGEAHKARPLLQRALAIDEKALGPDHPKVAIRLSNLALVLMDLGEQDKVRTLLERALAIATQRLGPNHPLTVRVGKYLASL